MPRKDIILNLPGFAIRKISGNNPIYIEVEYKCVVRCVHCNGKRLRKKSKFVRKVRHESIGLRHSYLLIKGHKYYCSFCNRYFNQQFSGIGKYQRATENLKRQVFHQHTQGASQKDLSCDLKAGKSMIERWYHERYWHEEKRKENRAEYCRDYWGIDEHFFSKKEGFATTFCNLSKNKIFDVIKGKSAKDLEGYLKKIPNKERVKVICIDLSSHFRSNQENCRRLLPIFTAMVAQLKQTSIKHLSTLGRTLHDWREEIVRMWRFTKNNGITEGFHRKMKLIQNIRGFRNFENYRLRVRVCPLKWGRAK